MCVCVCVVREGWGGVWCFFSFGGRGGERVAWNICLIQCIGQIVLGVSKKELYSKCNIMEVKA